MRRPLFRYAFFLVVLNNTIIQDGETSNSVVLNSIRLPSGTGPFPLQSVFQSEATETLTFLMFPGSNLDTSTSSFPNRYECAFNTVTFERSGLLVSITVETTDGLFCDVDFGDGSVDGTVDLNNTSNATIQHVYPRAGMYTPTFRCERETCPYSSHDCTDGGHLFDPFFQDISTPFKMLISHSYDILAVMNDNATCSNPSYNWRITRVADGDDLVPFVNFLQPNTPLIKIAKLTLPSGFYIVELEITFPLSPNAFVSDVMYAKVILPELISSISGGNILTFPNDQTYVADATKSRDPVASISSLPLNATWTVICYLPNSPNFYKEIHKYIVGFPLHPQPAGGTVLEVQPGTDFRLEFDTSFASDYQRCFIYFSLSHNDRLSTAVQVLTLSATAIPISIICVINCNHGREMKISKEHIQLDTIVTSLNYVTYRWRVNIWNTTHFVDNTAKVTIESGASTQSLGIPKDQLRSGWTYKFTVNANDGVVTGSASYIRTVNHNPYDGTCSLRDNTGYATTTLFMLECTKWQGTDERRTIDNVLLTNPIDLNPMLIIKVVQISDNAALHEEPVMVSAYRRLYLVLKLGDPDNSYNTTLSVQITDIYTDYTEVLLEVTSLPAFANFNVTPTENGADLVDAFMATDVVTSRNRIAALGSRDLLVIHTTTVASHFYHFDLPIWVPVIPENIYHADGVVLDLDPSGNITNSSLEMLLDDARKPSIDAATTAVGRAVEDLTAYVTGIMIDDVINGNRKEDTTFVSMITNCITNLVIKDNYVSGKTKVIIIHSGVDLSGVALFSEHEDEGEDDDGLAIENSSDELVALYTSTVEAVVPDRLKELTLVTDFSSGRNQLHERLEVNSANISEETANLSPEERTLLYFIMQKILEIEMDESRDLAREAAAAVFKMARDIQTANKLCYTCSNENRATTKQILVNNQADVIANRTISTTVGDIQITGLNSTEGGTNDNPVSVSVVSLAENVFMYDTNGRSSLISSGVLHVDVKSTLTETFVPTDSATFDQPVASPVFSHVTADLDPEDASRFSIHKFLYRFAEDTVCIKIVPNDPSVKLYKLYFHLTNAPTLLDYSFEREVGEADDWQLYVPPIDMNGHTGIVYVAVQIGETVTDKSYIFSVNTAACMTWEESQSRWTSDKCQLQWLPDDNKIRCHCSGVEQLTFANTFYATPNSIDFSSVFLRFSPLNQAAILGTLSLIVLVYVIVVIWARRKDRSDIYRWGTTPLLDNVYTDSYFYLITVHTGLRKGAGTKSRVGFRVTGEHGDTGDRELSDGVRKEIFRGSINTFLMSTASHLGDLLHLAVWHDNTGSPGNRDWYVSQFMVLDILTENTYTFVCEKWLSLSTCLQMTALANPKDRDIPIENRFYNQVKARLSEGHMWVSIAYRPVTSNFTRVQRASCATSYLLLTMVASALYFNPEDDYETPALIEAGPFRFQFQQVYISTISALISTPVVIIIAFLFKMSRRPRLPCRCGKRRNLIRKDRMDNLQQDNADLDLETTILLKGEVGEEEVYLPSAFYFVAWLLVLGACVTSAFFVLLFSIEWGKQKSEDWLSAFVLSLFESFFLVDPIMVCTLAVVLAIIIRSASQQKDGQDHVNLVLTYRKMLRNRAPFEIGAPPVRPVDGADMDTVIRRHKNEQYLMTAIKNIIINLFFMWIVVSIGYSNRDDRSFPLHKDIVDRLVSPQIKTLPKFEKILTPNDVYSWLEKTVFPTLFPEKDQYGEHLHWTMKEFMDGFTSYRLGPPRLRQLRTTEGECTLPYMGTVPCYGGYTIPTEDTSSSCIGWDNKPPCSKTEIAYNFSSDAWMFRSALDVWGLPVLGHYTTYGGGGYIAELGINRNISLQTLDELYKSLWVDRQTRAVILDFTLFCANVNLFVYNMFIVEFPETGGALTSYNIFPLRLYLHEDVNGVYTLICEVIFLLYLLFLLFKIGLTFYQQKRQYFQQVWQVFELVQFCVGIATVVIYFIRFTLTNTTISKFEADPKVFVNFYHVMFWDMILITLIGVLVFMGTLRMIQVFGTSKRVRILVKVFNDCGSDLFWFGLTFIFMWLSFSVLAYLLFGKQLFDYNSLYRSMTTLFTLTLGSSRFRDMNSSGSVMAKVFLLIFIFVMVFYTLTLFLSILCGSIDAMTAEMRNDSTDDLVDILIAKLKQTFHAHRYKTVQPYPEPDPELTMDSGACIPDKAEEDQTMDDIHVPSIECQADLLAFDLFWESGVEMDYKIFDLISQTFQRAMRRGSARTRPVYIDMAPSNWKLLKGF